MRIRNKYRWKIAVRCSLVAAIALFMTGCASQEENNDPCKGWTCSEHGQCQVDSGVAHCVCDEGYIPSEDGTLCNPGSVDPCKDITCSAHGKCQQDQEKKPYCVCDEGYWPSEDKLNCIENNCTDDCGIIGCCGSRCCLVIPSNSTDLGTLSQTGLVLTASGSFDTSANCSQGSLLGNCALVDLTHSPDVCVCRLDELTIDGTLRITGGPALAIFAFRSVKIPGTLNISAEGTQSGPGAETQDTSTISYLGGRGGSLGTKGGSAGVEPRGNDELIPLIGGQAGQNGCKEEECTSCGESLGGGGGGAIQITAGRFIDVTGTILAGGGGGSGGNTDDREKGTCLGAGGGGSGGAVLLEAPSMAVKYLYANGGGGGGGGNNSGTAGDQGSDSVADFVNATGGLGKPEGGCALDHYLDGGDGGQGAIRDLDGGDGENHDTAQCPDKVPYVGGGGGGGGMGRFRANSKIKCNCGPTSPTATFGTVHPG